MDFASSFAIVSPSGLWWEKHYPLTVSLMFYHSQLPEALAGQSKVCHLTFEISSNRCHWYMQSYPWEFGPRMGHWSTRCVRGNPRLYGLDSGLVQFDVSLLFVLASTPGESKNPPHDSSVCLWFPLMVYFYDGDSPSNITGCIMPMDYRTSIAGIGNRIR